MGTMFVCWSWASVCDSPTMSYPTFSATGRPPLPVLLEGDPGQHGRVGERGREGPAVVGQPLRPAGRPGAVEVDADEFAEEGGVARVGGRGEERGQVGGRVAAEGVLEGVDAAVEVRGGGRGHGGAGFVGWVRPALRGRRPTAGTLNGGSAPADSLGPPYGSARRARKSCKTRSTVRRDGPVFWAISPTSCPSIRSRTTSRLASGRSAISSSSTSRRNTAAVSSWLKTASRSKSRTGVVRWTARLVAVWCPTWLR